MASLGGEDGLRGELAYGTWHDTGLSTHGLLLQLVGLGMLECI